VKRLLIVADDAPSAETIRRGLRHAANCQVIGFVSGRRPCAMAVRTAQPDVVVVDDASATRSTLDRIRDVRLAADEATIVLLTPRMEPEWLNEAIAAGAHAAVARTVHPVSLGTLVREIAAGSVYHAFAAAPAEPVAQLEATGLTPRELQILQLMAAGASNSHIAGELWVTEQTVKFHLSNIYRKLGVANRTEASHYAHTQGLLNAVDRIGPSRRSASAAVAA
jgi:DNA-binding NarL/FixJ family response regulator